MPSPQDSAAPSRARQRTWQVPAVAGTIATIVLACHGVCLGYLPDGQMAWVMDHAQWLRSRPARATANVLALLAVLVLFECWRALHPRHGLTPPLRRILALWSVPLWLAPPVASGDAFAYAAQAWVMHQGLDPYTVPQGIPSPFSDGVYPLWATTTAVYPPLSLWAQLGMLRLGGVDPYWSVVAMRVLAIAGVALTVALLPALARHVGKDIDEVVWSAALNPLTVVVLIGGEHNDAMMIAALAAALLLVRRHHGLVWAGLAIGAAAAFKQVAVLAAPGIVLHGLPQAARLALGWSRNLARIAIAGVVGGLTFLGISYGSGLGLGWMNPSAGNPGMVSSLSPLSWVLATIRRTPGIDPVWLDVVGTFGTVATVAAIAWAAWRHALAHPLYFAALSLLAFGVCGPALQPWYFTWPGLLLVLCRLGERQRTVLMASVLAITLSGILTGMWAPPVSVPLSIVIAWAWWKLVVKRSPRSKGVRS